MNCTSEDLDNLFNEAISKLGIGGYVSTNDILSLYNPLTAENFAKIAYATDKMPSIYDNSSEAVNAENIEIVIRQNQFEYKPHFGHLVKMFVSRFDNQKIVTFK